MDERVVTSFPALRQTERHSDRQLPEMALRSLRRLYRGLPLPAGGADGGDGGAAERQEVRRTNRSAACVCRDRPGHVQPTHTGRSDRAAFVF